MATTSVSWDGLTKMILDFREKIPGDCQQAIEDMTQEIFDETLLRYVENLSGSTPSTEDDPLPVGIDSGDMLAHAWEDSRMINQFAFEIKNESEHSGWIEDGTERMAPRHPLQNAVDILESQMDVKLDSVMTEIFA